MKIEEYEEISHEEYEKLGDDEKAFFYDLGTKQTLYFKKLQIFPIFFEDEWFRYEIEKDVIKITARNTGGRFRFDYKDSFPLLIKAVEKAKEVINEN